jgi:hypothetical protein
MTARKLTFTFAEQKIREHVRTVLHSSLRISPSKLQLVVAGTQVCRQAFAWCHAFSDSTLNRVIAEVNSEYQLAHPAVIFMLPEIC